MIEERRSGRNKITPSRHVQYAALPYRMKGEDVEIMLVTSRGTRRWIIPKGWPKSGMTPPDTAAEEAYEEAGVVGNIAERPVGSYSYDKMLRDGRTVRCTVRVFALEVTRQRRKWPEMLERRTEWYAPGEAAELVQEPRLRRIIRHFARTRPG